MYQEQNINFPWNNKIFKLCLKDYIFRSYHFFMEVTFKSYFPTGAIVRGFFNAMWDRSKSAQNQISSILEWQLFSTDAILRTCDILSKKATSSLQMFSNKYLTHSRAWPSTTFKSSHPELFCKKGVFKNFTKFTGKHLCQSLFLNKVAGLRPATLLKKRLWYSVFLWIFWNF